MSRRIRKVLAVGPVRGDVEPLERLLGDELPRLEVDAIAVVGDLERAERRQIQVKS